MADIIAALVALVSAEASITDIAGNRIYGGEMPVGAAQITVEPSLVISPSGGASLTSASFVEADTQRFDLLAFGPTTNAAAALNAAAAPVLRRTRRSVYSGVLIHWIQSAGGYSSARDPVTAWPRIFQSFQVFHSLQEI